MIRIAARCRDSARRNRTRSLRPDIEGLEDRKLLSTASGGKWVYPVLITYSFLPDGTHIGAVDPPLSNLFSTFNAIAPTATWQAQFQKAAAIWQKVAGINLAQVSDDGSTLGGNGNQQGDPRFGDIRIGGYAMDTSSGIVPLALAFQPPPINGGSEAGDILVNTAMPWKINNDFDLLTVAIHEFGHSLGMGHSAIAAADMYAAYTGMKQSLTADDTSGIQSIYGGTPPDTIVNNSAATAINLTPWMDPQGRISYNAGYVESLADAEWYKVVVPSTTTGSMTVTMQSTGLSSLSPRMAILNSSQVAIGQALAQYQYGATVSYTVNGVVPGQTYYIRATSAQNAPGWNGAFGLLVNFGTSPLPPVAPPYTVVGQQLSHGGGSQNETAPQSLRHVHAGRGRGHGHSAGHDDVVIKLGKTKAVADLLVASPRRHLRPARFRHA